MGSRHNSVARTAVVALVVLLAPLSAAPKKFDIIRAAVHQIEDGPPAAADSEFVPGETVFFSCQMDGYQVSAAKRVAINYRLEAVDFQGVRLMEPVVGKVDAELAAEDKEWRPKVRQDVFVPPLAGSGTYKVRITATDEIGGATVTKEVAFNIRGHDVEPSDTLVVRNFRFYRSEEDPGPLRIAAYRPGDTVWARFDLTGYKLGPGNQVHVSYTVTVTAESGRVLFTQKEPTVEQSQSFYPKRYLPCVINLSLQPNIARGEYTIRVAVRDHLGNQDHPMSPTFRVE